jgi:hypothetical protein
VLSEAQGGGQGEAMTITKENITELRRDLKVKNYDSMMMRSVGLAELLLDQLEKLLKVAEAAKEVDVRWRDPYTTHVRTTAALIAMGKTLAATTPSDKKIKP